MPQILKLGSFEAWINVDGEPLQVFAASVSEDGLTATGWIPSEKGKVRISITRVAAA
jgi:hypothetical protein